MATRHGHECRGPTRCRCQPSGSHRRFTFADNAEALSFWEAFRRDPQILSLTDRWTNAQALLPFFAVAHTVFEVKTP